MSTSELGTPAWMMGGDGPDLGTTLVNGKDQPTAAALLAAAEALGHDVGVVRTVSHGFLVPNDVYDYVVDHGLLPGTTPATTTEF